METEEMTPAMIEHKKTLDTFYQMGLTYGHLTAISQVFDAFEKELTPEQLAKLLSIKPLYELGEQKPSSNMHPIFADALKPFGIK